MKAQEFVRQFPCDPDWVKAVADRDIPVYRRGEHITYNGRPAVIYGHYHNGMYEIKTPGGIACVSCFDFFPPI